MTPRAPLRLVLVGGGHAQVHVLDDLARTPLQDVVVTLVHPGRAATYTGMIPGLLAGLYRPGEADIDVAALATRSGATHLDDRVIRLRPAERLLDLERHGTLPYDVLALDVGARPLGSEVVAPFAHVVPIKPIEVATRRIDDALAGACRGFVALVVGGGAGGVEVAFALRRCLAGAGGRVSLLERGDGVLLNEPARLRRLLARCFAAAAIDVENGVGEVVPVPGGVRLGDGSERAADLVVWATGAEGLPLVAGSGLRCDERGFLFVDDFLRAPEAPAIFAAGDCSCLVSAPWVPRAGVYAVRQGPILARNLRVAVSGQGTLAPFRPQRRFLRLLSTADRRALMSYGPLAAHGRAWWWLKDAIDRRFVRRFVARFR